jgi:uncharacterized protein YndB with AHSA1/START domain
LHFIAHAPHVQPERCGKLRGVNTASTSDPTSARIVDTGSSTLAVRRTLDLGCDAADLWRFVTDERDLARWFGREVSIDARPRGRGRVVEDDGTIRTLVVREVVDGERLAFSWWVDGDEASRTEVSFEVQSVDDHSRLVVTETAVAATPAAGAAVTTSSWDTRLISLWLSVCALARV